MAVNRNPIAVGILVERNVHSIVVDLRGYAIPVALGLKDKSTCIHLPEYLNIVNRRFG